MELAHGRCWVVSYDRHGMLSEAEVERLHQEDKEEVKWTQEWEFSHGAMQAHHPEKDETSESA